MELDRIAVFLIIIIMLITVLTFSVSALEQNQNDIRDNYDSSNKNALANKPPQITKLSPDVDKLRQRNITFEGEAKDSDGKIVKVEADLIKPGGTLEYETINSNSFTENLSELNEGDKVVLKVRITDDDGAQDEVERTYTMWKDEQPNITVTSFDSSGRFFLGEETPKVQISLKNKDPVRAEFNGKLIHRESVKDTFSVNFSPSSSEKITRKISFETAGRKEVELRSKGKDIGTPKTTVKVRNPIRLSLSVSDNNLLKTENITVTLDIERKTGVESIVSTRGKIELNGNSRDFNRIIGAKKDTVKERYTINKEGTYKIKVLLNKPGEISKKEEINVKCINRRQISRGEENYECETPWRDSIPGR